MTTEIIQISDRAAEAIEAAKGYQNTSAQEKLTMFNEQNQPIYSAEEHQKRMPDYEKRQQQHLLRFRERLGSIEQEARDQIADADRTLASLRLDPVDRLSGNDLTTAAARKTFVSEDTERMPLPDLIARLEAVALGSDKVAQALYLRYATIRAKEAEAERGGRSEGVQALKTALGKLDAALTDEKTTVARRKAEARKTAAERTLMGVQDARNQADPEARAELRRRFGIRDY